MITFDRKVLKCVMCHLSLYYYLHNYNELGPMWIVSGQDLKQTRAWYKGRYQGQVGRRNESRSNDVRMGQLQTGPPPARERCRPQDREEMSLTDPYTQTNASALATRFWLSLPSTRLFLRAATPSISWLLPGKHEKLTDCWFNGGPASQTMAPH